MYRTFCLTIPSSFRNLIFHFQLISGASQAIQPTIYRVIHKVPTTKSGTIMTPPPPPCTILKNREYLYKNTWLKVINIYFGKLSYQRIQNKK